MAGNLKLEVTNYSRSLYDSGEAAHTGDGDCDGDKEDSKATPSYQPKNVTPLITCS